MSGAPKPGSFAEINARIAREMASESTFSQSLLTKLKSAARGRSRQLTEAEMGEIERREGSRDGFLMFDGVQVRYADRKIWRL